MSVYASWSATLPHVRRLTPRKKLLNQVEANEKRATTALEKDIPPLFLPKEGTKADQQCENSKTPILDHLLSGTFTHINRGAPQCPGPVEQTGNKKHDNRDIRPSAERYLASRNRFPLLGQISTKRIPDLTIRFKSYLLYLGHQSDEKVPVLSHRLLHCTQDPKIHCAQVSRHGNSNHDAPTLTMAPINSILSPPIYRSQTPPLPNPFLPENGSRDSPRRHEKYSIHDS